METGMPKINHMRERERERERERRPSGFDDLVVDDD
jgi:hypothetical protein